MSSADTDGDAPAQGLRTVVAFLAGTIDQPQRREL